MLLQYGLLLWKEERKAAKEPTVESSLSCFQDGKMCFYSSLALELGIFLMKVCVHEHGDVSVGM